MQIESNFPLQKLNTFGIDVSAKKYSVLHNENEITEIINVELDPSNLLLLGGGSNMLFTQAPTQWVIKNEISGIKLINENEENVWLQVGAGEVWHQFVMHCINNNLGGVENLSLIPGTVGAAPIQNIGAYGVEVKDVIASVRFWHLREHKFVEIENKDCQFGYRDSIFKNDFKHQFIITSVIFKLNKIPKFNISYGNIEAELEKMNIKELSVKSISDAVINIRTSKLPDPKKIGNAGSFFKNALISTAQFHKLQIQYPDIPHYSSSNNSVKIPAAWLIEQCGWKGYRSGNYGVHEKQALVLVNYGDAQGKDIYNLSQHIIESVQNKFQITLTREVQII